MKFFTSSLVAYMLAASTVIAGSIPPPKKTFVGDMTYYTPGLGSCGKTNNASDLVVSLSNAVMKNPANPNDNPICGKTVTIRYGGKKATGKVEDTCSSCAKGDINVSPPIFEKFAPLSEGRVPGVSWHFNK